MSTRLFGCALTLLFAWMSAPAAWGQVDAPPEIPSWADPETKPVKPAPRVTAPAAAPKPAPARAPHAPLVSPNTPQRLSYESTAHLPTRVQNVIDFYGGATSARALAQLPNRPSSGMSSPPPVQQVTKPFEGSVSRPPTVSPYLNLFIEESDEAPPNYFAYVRPALQQQQTNRRAQREFNTLQREIRTVSYGEAVQNQGAGVPSTGHGTRYLNRGRYYPTTRRLR
ncbi:hypothetical protein [Aeoliella sp.]|uniref:hypothetical protein n=1 Tax=Aeoliella sp. TaxID=2795800 RepID=UPI003CCC1A02